MKDFGVNCLDVSEILNVKSNTPRVWRCKNGNAMPDKSYELLKLKLESRNT